MLAATELDPWAQSDALPSDTEITLVRQLVQRVEHDLDELPEHEREQVREAATLLRTTRNFVGLGMPRIAPPRPHLEGHR